MLQPRPAQVAFAVTAVVTAAALVLQLVLILLGNRTLAEAAPPPLGIALLRFVEYFTVQSNILVLVTTAVLARRPDRDGPVWRVLRADAIAGIAVTGLVHFFLLRPLLHLTGGSYVADKLLHMVVPVLALVGWLVWGPRPRLSVRTCLWALLWPLAWTAVVLVVGGLTRWFPYPFLNFYVIGGTVVGYCIAITVLFVVVFALMVLADRRLRPTSVSRASESVPFRR